jgi:flagellar hook-associated protein 3 FlgL
MRVTSTIFPDTLIQQLGLLAQRQQQLQAQAATGQRVRNPEDDPAAMRRVLDMQTESHALNQYATNAASLSERADAAYNAISALQKISTRISELATLADGTKSPSDLQLYGVEVSQLIKQAVDIANTKYQGDYLFAGTLSDQAPFMATTDSEGRITAVAYQGNTSVAGVAIAQGVTLSVLLPGANTSGSGPGGLITDSRTGADLFAHMISLQNHLQAGDVNAIAATDRPALQADEQNLILQSTSVSVAKSRLEAASSSAKERNASLNTLISGEADADLAQTIVRLTEIQNAYRAALQTGATILSQSLLDYLK